MGGLGPLAGSRGRTTGVPGMLLLAPSRRSSLIFRVCPNNFQLHVFKASTALHDGVDAFCWHLAVDSVHLTSRDIVKVPAVTAMEPSMTEPQPYTVVPSYCADVQSLFTHTTHHVPGQSGYFWMNLTRRCLQSSFSMH